MGLLYSSAAPVVIEAAGALVESLDIIPERLFYDLGPQRAADRFHRVDGALAELRRHSAGRHTSGHGIGMSLPSDMPLDEALLDVVDDLASTIGFAWYSEHLSSFATMRGAVPNAQAGLGLPVPYDEDVLTMLAAKVTRVQDRLGMRLLLENPAVFTPVPGCDYREPEFLNELAGERAAVSCSTCTTCTSTSATTTRTATTTSNCSTSTTSSRSTSPAAPSCSVSTPTRTPR